MYNNIDKNNNSILIDTTSNTSNKKRKIKCVLCISKPELVCINPEENRWKCPRCKNDYQLGFGEIIPEEDVLESSHEDDEDSVGLLSADNEFKLEDESKDSISRPAYMKDSATTKVTYYRE